MSAGGGGGEGERDKPARAWSSKRRPAAEPPRLYAGERVIRTAEQCVVALSAAGHADRHDEANIWSWNRRSTRGGHAAREAGATTRGGRCERAPLAARIVDKGLVSDRIVIDTLTRSTAITSTVSAERDAGARGGHRDQPGDDGRLGDAGGRAAAALGCGHGTGTARGAFLQADKVPVAVQLHDGNGANHQAYLWQYGRPRASTVLIFRWAVDGKVRSSFSVAMKVSADRWLRRL